MTIAQAKNNGQPRSEDERQGRTGPGEQQVFEEILLRDPPPLRIAHQRVPTDKVDFDAGNPRLKYKKEQFPDASDSDLLFKDNDTRYLQKDIEEKGVLEPIYVRAYTAPNGERRYRVVEGNRRSACMQDLQAKHPENPRFAYIPARVLPEHTTPVQEAVLMASMHVAGKLKWDAHEKAGHIWSLINEHRIPGEDLKNTLHMGLPAINKAADSYAVLQHFKRMDAGRFADQAEGKWSFFAEMLKSKELAERHKKGQDWDDQFCRWVGEGRLKKAEDVRDLPEILRHLSSRKAFLDEPVDVAFDKAKAVIDKSRPARNSKFYKDLERLVTSIKTSQFDDQAIAMENEAARDTVLEAHSLLLQFMERAGIRAPGTPRRVA